MWEWFQKFTNWALQIIDKNGQLETDIKNIGFWGFIILFIIFLLSDKVRDFILNLPVRIWRYFRKRNFKEYKSEITVIQHAKLFRQHYKWVFCNKDYLMACERMSEYNEKTVDIIKEKELMSPAVSGQVSHPVSVRENTSVNQKQELEISNQEMIKILDCFCLYNAKSQTLCLDKTLLSEILRKLAKEKVNLKIKTTDAVFTKVPLCRLASADFQIPTAEIIIETEL